MNEAKVVLQETSPHNNLEAIVEQDDRVAYLYLRAPGNEAFGLKTCWIRNLTDAPAKLDIEAMRDGIAPMLPRDHCLYPSGQLPLDGRGLNLVWFPEGDGVALLEDGEMLAAIPPWGGLKGFSGYARDCEGESPFCWKLKDTTEFNQRIAAAQRFWRDWDEGSPWQNCQEAFMNAYEEAVGKHSRYFSIDGNQWPPKALIRVDAAERKYLLTLGISLRPQPSVEMHVNDPTNFRRFEFAACFSPEVSDEILFALASYLSAQSSLPWTQFTFLAHGHTIRCDSFSSDPILQHFTSILLVENPPNGPKVNVPRSQGEKVSLLWVVPITDKEQKIVEKEGSKVIIEKFSSPWPLHLIGRRNPISL